MAVVLQFPLQTFFHNVFEEIKKRQDDITRKKIIFLFNEAYKNFLEQYLVKVAKFEIVDFPAFMYLSGSVVCQEAFNQATEVMISVVTNGRVNQCYTARIKELRKSKKGF